MKAIYRAARKEDSYRIAELDYIASGGAAEYLFRGLVPGSTPVQIIASGLESDAYPHSYKSAIVAELNNEIVGMSMSFPAAFHCINDEMREFFPADRLAHFEDFFSASVSGSYLLDAICVNEEYRSLGIGDKLLEKTIQKARSEGFSVLSLLVFADNHKAIDFYTNHGFSVIRKVELKEHRFIPHKGGCLLMKAEI